MKLTLRSIETLKASTKGQSLYYDDQLKGFGIRITSKGTKSYFVEKRMGDRVRRLTIARANVITVEVARKEATKILGQIALGNDPFIQKDALKKASITIEKIFDQYVIARKHLSLNTIYSYQRMINIYLAEWKSLHPGKITKEMVAAKHIDLAEKHDPSTANIAMKLLRSLYTFYQAMNEDLEIRNPVNFLTITKAWYKIPVRKNYIKSHQLKPWYEALQKVRSDLKDYLLFILFTGLRRQEAAKLKWENVDFAGRSFTIINPKNGVTHELPLTDHLYKTLFYKERTNQYVFPGQGVTGHILDPRVAIKSIIQETGISFSIHDLRRTFATIADSLDVGHNTLKRLLNHKSNADVTAGYIGINVERLRAPMERISQFLLAEF